MLAFGQLHNQSATARVEASPHMQQMLSQLINMNVTVMSYLRHHTTIILRPFFRDHPGQPVPEENFWTLWCKGKLTQAHTLTVWLGATPPLHLD